jgi:hypothetical protein
MSHQTTLPYQSARSLPRKLYLFYAEMYSYNFAFWLAAMKCRKRASLQAGCVWDVWRGKANKAAQILDHGHQKNFFGCSGETSFTFRADRAFLAVGVAR